jgi:crotonobetainyl-CoA:carnitine CoA-transferase CaiB-like acyl-CoA transferase
MEGPLTGIRVLELAAMQNGPACGYILGDMGAEVIKIEDPKTGDMGRGFESYGDVWFQHKGVNIFFETPNRSKKAITLDLKKEKGRGVFYQLVSKSDVFFTNYSPSVCERLGCSYEDLLKHNPKLIYGRASGYGSRGPESESSAFDTAAQARSGFMMKTGERKGPPVIAVAGIFDQLGATMLAFSIVSALLARERLGIGQQVEASLLGSAIHLQAQTINQESVLNRSVARHSRIKARNPLGNHYMCEDGKWIILAEPRSERFWRDFCQAMGEPELVEDPRFKDAPSRGKNCQECIVTLDKIFSTKPRDEWVEILKEKVPQMAFTKVMDLAEVLEDPQILANEYVVDYDHPIFDEVKLVGFPMWFSETPCTIKGKAPEFGEHTEQILVDMGGYTWEEIIALKEENVIL